MAIHEEFEENIASQQPISLKLLLLLFGGFFVFMSASVGVVVMLLLKQENAMKAPSQEFARVEHLNNLAPPAAASTSQSMHQAANYISIKPAFVVNYEVNGKSRYLQISVDVMSRSDAVLTAVEKHIPKIKNDLITLFSEQDFEFIQSAEGKEQLRQSALAVVQKVVHEETSLTGVEEILFTSYVTQ